MNALGCWWYRNIAMRKILFILFASTVVALSSAKGQLCNGSLGDPVVNITFGAGGNPGPPLRAAGTTYAYQSADCPPDGSYTVFNSTFNCFGSTWWALNEDHTPGDQNGYFMLVNANFTPGVFYLDTVKGLCTNTTYEFAAWVVNVLKNSACGGSGIDPNLTFTIETTTGQELAKYETGNIAESSSPQWKQYGLFFTTTAATTSVVVRIVNNAPGGCGNDLGLDDITFRPCGPKVNASLTINGDTTAQLCYGDPLNLTLGSNHSAGYNNPVFQWQVSIDNGPWTDIPNETNTSYLRTPTTAGLYRYRLTMAESTNATIPGCRVASNQVNITVHALPDPMLQDETSACQGKPDSLVAIGGVQYTWTGPNGFTSTDPKLLFSPIQFSDAGWYKVVVRSDAGCVQADSTRLVVNPAVDAQVSNTVSVCEGVGTALISSGGVDYQWSPPDGLSSTGIANPFANPSDTTTYLVTIYNQFGCFDTASVTVNIWKKPVANAGPDKRMKEGNPVILEGTAEGTNVSYYWTPSIYLDNSNAIMPVANPPHDTTYTLNVVSGMGCGTSTDKVFVRVYQQIYVPNAFSPNGDGTNDTWKIEKLGTYPEADIQVFNRNGQVVFKSRGYSKPWNGTFNGAPLPVGTYYYIIDLKTDIFPKVSGWVFIAR